MANEQEPSAEDVNMDPDGKCEGTVEALVTPIAGAELLNRAVKDDIRLHSWVDGRFVLSVNAFNDRYRKPSVDRDQLRDRPESSRKNDTDGVVQLTADEVRACQVVTNDAKGKPQHSHGVDAVHAPLAENYSHAEIRASPDITSGTAYDRLKEQLQRAAHARGWVVRPASLR